MQQSYGKPIFFLSELFDSFSRNLVILFVNHLYKTVDNVSSHIITVCCAGTV